MRDKRKIRHLPEAELDIMLSVWAKGPEGVTAPEIAGALARPLTASALHTYLKRLEERGFVSRSKEGKINRYTALVDKEAYQEREGRSVLEKLYDNSLKRFTAALYDGGALSREDLAELRSFLDGLEEETVSER